MMVMTKIMIVVLLNMMLTALLIVMMKFKKVVEAKLVVTDLSQSPARHRRFIPSNARLKILSLVLRQVLSCFIPSNACLEVLS